MMKIVIISSMLLAFAVSEIVEFDNNFIEYEPIRPAQSISIPYPYQDNRHKPVVLETVSAPIYSDTYENIVLPSTSITEVEPAGFFSTAISCTFDAAKAALTFLLTNAPALVAGTIVALGVCKLTSLCDSEVTIYEVESELRTLASSERLSRAAKFVKEAVTKYNEMQKV